MSYSPALRDNPPERDRPLPEPELRLVGPILTPERLIPRGLLRASEGRVTRLEPWGGPPPPGAEEVEGWIVPGMLDLQVNGFAGQDFADPSADLDRASLSLAAHGVTAFLPTLISAQHSLYVDRLPNMARPLPGAVSLGVHLEGPYLNPTRRGAHPPHALRLPDQAEIEQLLEPGTLRVLTLAPELPGALEAITRLRARGVVVSLGHSDASYAQALAALDAGATLGTHLFNAMRPFAHREPGLPGALLTDERTTLGIIADGLHLHPAALQLALRARGAHGLALVTDAIAAAGMPDGLYPLGALQVSVRAGQARLADGTLAGSVLSIDQALRNTLEITNCSLSQALTMATASPARALGLGDKGILAPGADADIVHLSPDLRVLRTFVAGKLVYTAPPREAEPTVRRGLLL